MYSNPRRTSSLKIRTSSNNSTSTTYRVPQQNYNKQYRFTNNEIQLLRATYSCKYRLSNWKEVEVGAKQTQFIEKSKSLFNEENFWEQVESVMHDSRPDLMNFLPNIDHQIKFFGSILYTAIQRLEDLSVMESYLEPLGRKHIRVFGARNEHFECMGNSVIEVLQGIWGDAFTEEIEAVWIKLYLFLANCLYEHGSHDIVASDEQMNGSGNVYQTCSSFIISSSSRVNENKPACGRKDGSNNMSRVSYSHSVRSGDSHSMLFNDDIYGTARSSQRRTMSLRDGDAASFTDDTTSVLSNADSVKSRFKFFRKR